MLNNQLKDVYHQMLTDCADSQAAVELLRQVLANIYNYLIEEELKMMKAEAECKNRIISVSVSPFICYFI